MPVRPREPAPALEGNVEYRLHNNPTLANRKYGNPCRAGHHKPSLPRPLSFSTSGLRKVLPLLTVSYGYVRLPGTAKV